MRITTGLAKGRPVPVPPGDNMPPSTDRLRLALFNILGPGFGGSSFLDLFCGSGAVGLEALSRGAAKVVFCDAEKRCAAQAGALALSFGFSEENFEVIAAPYRGALERLAAQGRRFDAVFIDPPYQLGLGQAALQAVVQLAIVSQEATARVFHERSSAEVALQVDGLRLLKDHVYGSSALAVYALGG